MSLFSEPNDCSCRLNFCDVCILNKMARSVDGRRESIALHLGFRV